ADVGSAGAGRAGGPVCVREAAPIGIESTDAYEQAKRCLAIIVDALRELGAAPEHVVRTRVYLVDAADWEAVGLAHGEVFGPHPPASAMLVVKGLLDPVCKVELHA